MLTITNMFLKVLLKPLFSFLIVEAVMLGIPTLATPICKSADPQVLILGAGMSGVTAARKLYDAGMKDFIILEGRDKIGGRFDSVDFVGEKTDIGCGIISGVDSRNSGNYQTNPLWTLTQQCGVKTVLFPGSFLAYNTSAYRVFSSSDQAVVDAFNRYNTAFYKARQLSSIRRAQDNTDISVRAALNMSGWFPVSQLDKLVDWINGEFLFGELPENVGMYGVDSDHTFDDFGGDSYAINDTRGAQYLVQCLGEPFLNPPILHLNTFVNSIEYSTECVCASVTENGNSNRYCGKYGIVTFSVEVFQSGKVLYSPPLPQWKLDAYNKFRLPTFLQIFIQFDEVFWDPSVNFVFSTDVTPDVAFAPVFGRYINQTTVNNVIVMVVFSSLEHKILNQGINDTKQDVYTALRSLYGNFTAKIVDIYVPTRPLEDTYGVLGYLSPKLGVTHATFYNLSIPLGNLYFGGEVTSEYYYAYAVGAYQAGNTTANAILNRMASSERKCTSEQAFFAITCLAALFYLG